MIAWPPTMATPRLRTSGDMLSRSVDADAKRLLELGARIDLDFNLDEAVDGLATVFFGTPGVDQATAHREKSTNCCR